MNLNDRINEFAKLAVSVGINIKPGETLLIRADIEAYDFVRRCVKEAYSIGAKHVYVEYSDEYITRERYLNAPIESFDEYPSWQSDKYTDIAKNGGAFLSIISNDPDALKDIDSDRIARFQKVSAKYLKEWRSYTMNDRAKWSIVAVPSKKWAKKVFPTLDEEEALKKLWISILDASRVCENSIEAWKTHNAKLQEKTALLNKMNFKKLIYKSSKTDLTIGLPKGHIWVSGAAKDPLGNSFNPNIPTEEIYGMPHKYEVDGVVFSTKPLIYSGSIIDDFWFKFESGKIVDFGAEKGYENLKKLINTDEGSKRLGEIALVPYDSPISKSGILFYSTLFDENASCHLAIGAAYGSCIENGASIEDVDKDKIGMNQSLTHVDFMIGDNDLDISGITWDNKHIQIFKNGNWADFQ